MSTFTLPAAGTLLTPREVEILTMAANGRSTQQIARDLSVSTHTVKDHMRRIFTRLGAVDRTHAVALALRTEQLRMDAIHPRSTPAPRATLTRT